MVSQSGARFRCAGRAGSPSRRQNRQTNAETRSPVRVVCRRLPFLHRHEFNRIQETGITDVEFLALQNQTDLDTVSTLSTREKLAVRYARLISSTPLQFPPEFIAGITANFTEREMVVLASTAAQVNYWARLIQALGIPPSGFSDGCSIKPHRQATEGH